jgi:pimeloyl-ACP methyl ester carboxylesterase|tara:strand:+ start:4887 stop:5942 length:1056 start_codon:yes stop_codon:yes gene_type:complete
VGGIKEYWNSNSRRSKVFSVATVTLLLLAPIVWFGLGHVIAMQALTSPHGCGIWETNTPTNWTSNDDWESFEPWPDSDERISMRKNFDVVPWQFEDYENVSFESRDGINLAAWYSEVNESAPVVILVHGGYLNGKCKPEVILTASYLAAGGINTLMIDLRNNGDSEIVSDYMYLGQKEYLDVLGAYDWLIDEKSYSSSSIGLIGISTGALTASLAFGDSEIQALWLDSAIIDFPMLVENELERLGYPKMLASPAITMGERIIGINPNEVPPVTAASKAGDRPMYLTHGEDDGRISPQHSQKFYDEAISSDANVTLWMIDGSGHVDAVWEHQIEYQERLVSFFSGALENKII